MRRRLVVYFTALVLLLPAIASAQYIKWNPVCRHNALYWAATVGENYQTRIVHGWFIDKDKIKYFHVQPQLRFDKNWYFFKVENDHVVIIDKPRYLAGTTWHQNFIFPTLHAYMEWFSPILKGEEEPK